MHAGRRSRSTTALRSAAVVLPLLSILSLLPSAVASAEEDAVAGDTVVGEVVQAWPEYRDHAEAAEHGDEGPLTWIETAPGDTVRVPTEDLDGIPVGSTVEVSVGAEVADVASEEHGLEPAREVLGTEVLEAAAAEPPPTAESHLPVTNQVTVVRVVPSGATQDSTTLATVVDLVNGPVHDFWAEQSDQAIQIAATGWAGWVPTRGCSDPFGMWQDAAAATGFVPGAGRHLLLYVTTALPAGHGCSDGLAEVGTGRADGGSLYVRYATTSIVAHELGHNFGLGHSSAVRCSGTSEEGGTGCRVVAYDDWYDVMGFSWAQVGSLNPPHAARIGLLPTAQQQVITADGSRIDRRHTLLPTADRTGLRAIKLVVPPGVSSARPGGSVYWLEYRTPVGRDAWLGTTANQPGLPSGVLLRREGSGSHTSLLLDATPHPTGIDSSLQDALPVGATVQLAGGALTVTVEGVTASGATVRITGPRPALQLPTGNWESLSAAGPTLSVRGWALDLDVPLEPVLVHVYVDGRGYVVPADGSRPDVGAAFPAAGAAHGFSWSGTVAPGEHRVCLYAIDPVVPSSNRSMGCRTISTQVAMPVGNWEGLSASGGNVTVRGWTFDPDDGGRSVPVHVYVDGRASVIAADQARPDVGAVFPSAGSLHGFGASIPVAPGEHRVCLYAIDADLPFRNTALGCRTISTQVALPVGNWEGLSASGGNVTVRGWTFDPDDGGRAVPVHVYVDGRASVVAANQARPDVAAAFPAAGSLNGFSASLPVAPGEHRVCLYAIDADLPFRNSGLGCRTVHTQVALPVGNWEGLSASGGNLTVRGWTFDPDDGGRAVPVHVYVDGRASVIAANQARPDVAAVFPTAGSQNGFSASLPVAPGEHRVCLYAIDADLPFRNTSLGCRVISSGLALPVGNWEGLSASGGNVTVRGWTFDPDDGGRAVPVHVYVDGRASVIAADQARPDVGAAFPAAGNLHGFAASVPAAPGAHRVCLYAIDADLPFRNTGLGCRTVTVPPLTAAEAVEAAWVELGAEDGPLGQPVTALQDGLVRGGHYREFQGGAIYWTSATGANAVFDGPIRDDWERRGAETSGQGYPTTDTFCGLVDGGCGQHFEGGVLYYNSNSVQSVTGPFLEAWAESGWEEGPFGYPTDSGARYGDGHVEQAFQNAVLYWTERDGITVVY